MAIGEKKIRQLVVGKNRKFVSGKKKSQNVPMARKKQVDKKY